MALVAKATKPKLSDKKRLAKHHRTSKHYAKAYWPYLPMLLVVGLGLVFNATLNNHAVLGATSDFSSNTFLQATNRDRTDQHEGALALNDQLTTAAVAKANDMVTNNYWSHTSPQGKTPLTFINGSNYQYQVVGENLAYGFNGAQQTIDAWMSSPEHRANILNTNYSQVGFGIASSPNYLGNGPATIIVAEYGEPSASAANISFKVDSPTAVPSGTLASTNQNQPPARLVSRIQLMSNGIAPWAVLALFSIASSALTLFVVRHAVRFKRLLRDGELFLAHHVLLDSLILVIAISGFILTRTSGFIR